MKKEIAIAAVRSAGIVRGRASERAAELARERKTVENKLLRATIRESNISFECDDATAQVNSAAEHARSSRLRLEEAERERKSLAAQLAELSKD